MVWHGKRRDYSAYHGAGHAWRASAGSRVLLNKRLLMIAYHFPPLAGSSGIQRTLRFARYLPEFGWSPIVLTAHPRAYPRCSDDQLGDIPSGVEVVRAPAWDAARHFSIAGRYPGFVARPDRWVSWWFGAIPSGLKLIRRYRPVAIWSTYPIATAHCIGATLSKRSKLPWISDFRDPMAQDGYPSDLATWRSFARIERNTVTQARLSIFTTPSAVDTYRERYPERAERIRLIENGYDEETFSGTGEHGGALNSSKLTLLHSGVVYPSERDPRRLFSALEQLKNLRPEVFERLCIRFRAPGHVGLLQDLAHRHSVETAIEILPPVSYREALAEMLRADGLLILQASNCNAQVPAKLYEYLRARRPIIALTDSAGDTARVARSAGIKTIAPLDNASAIAELLGRFVHDPEQGTLPTEDAIAGASRRRRTEQLAECLDRVLS